jgi:UreD urease accessory protein
MRGRAVAARRTEPDTVYLVSAAATPLGGDAIHIRMVVEAGARLRMHTAAATVTLPGSTTPESHAFWTLEVAGDLRRRCHVAPLQVDPAGADGIRLRPVARTHPDRQIL